MDFMQRSFKVLFRALVGLLLAAGSVHASSPTAPGYKPPRLPDGRPSLEGTWTNASLTSLQRPERFVQLVIPPSEIEALINSHPQVVRQRTDDASTGNDSNTALDGSDLRGGRGYNAFWIDPGMTYAKVKGEYRTSFIIDPPDGQIPRRQDVAARGDARNNFDGPEARPLGERCVINSGSAGPPMLTYLYNNNYEIVQTRDTLAIRVEMNNYARVIRIGGKHLPMSLARFHGDSIGRWEGDTLVIETTHFHALHARANVGLSPNAKVTERLTRYSQTHLVRIGLDCGLAANPLAFRS
jgi:hypothetical protein